MSTPNAITIESLRIDYDDTTAVRDLSLTIRPGQIFGLVGPNGAGKTSTIKAIAGIIEPTYGEIRINGQDLQLNRADVLKSVGYMPDFPPVYEKLKVWEYLDVFAAAYLIAAEDRPKAVEHWLEKTNLTAKRESLIKDLSRGMRQRVVLAKTLLPRPKVLLLDEPASGLDPISRREMRDILKDAADAGAAVLISSHILTELEGFCDAVGIMEKGNLAVAGSLDEIRAKMSTSARLIIRWHGTDASVAKRLTHLLAENSCIDGSFQQNATELQLGFKGNDSDAHTVLKSLMEKNIPVTEFFIKKDDVEDIFFKIGAKEVS